MDALSHALDQAGGSHIGFGVLFHEHLGLRLRRSEVERWVIRNIPNARWTEGGLLEAPRPNGAAQRRLLAFLSRVAARPLTGRLVVQTLGITNQERVRWTKDGRLPTSGTARIRRGQVISIPTYDVEVISALAGKQNRIALWRAEDAV